MRLRYEDFESITRSHTLMNAVDGNEVIFDVGLQLLKMDIRRGRRKVRLIGIGVSNLLDEGRQLHMLYASPSRLVLLNKAIDRLHSRYGYTAIQTGLTLSLSDVFQIRNNDYMLKTSCLSR